MSDKKPPTGIYRPVVFDKGGRRRETSIWWIRYGHHGKKYFESSGSKRITDAIKLRNKRLGEIGAHRFIGPDADKTTLKDIAQMYLDDLAANGVAVKHHAPLQHVRDFFGDATCAHHITTDRVTAFVKSRREEKAKPATINRSLAALKRAFHLAQIAERVARVPHIAMIEENNTRTNFIEQPQFDKLHAALPDDLKDPILFLWLTAWRVNEMRSLEWRDVFTDAIRLRPENSKNGCAREIPLTGELGELIARARGAMARSGKTVEECPFVFMRNGTKARKGRPARPGRAMGMFRKSWKTACDQAKIKGTWVHDLRRSAIRNLMASGVSQSVVMSISGHRTIAVFNRYNIASQADKTAAFERRDEIFVTPKRKLAFARSA
jgi:integrase